MDYYSLAIKRESTRDFKKKPVSDHQMEEIKRYLGEHRRLLPDITVYTEILGPEVCSVLKGCAGYHTFMIEAPHYLLISSETADHYLENAGYIGEDLVLKLTELGLQSCWITIGDCSAVAERLGLPVGRIPAALIAFGSATAVYPSSRLDIKSISDILIKKRTGFVAPKLALDQAVYTGTWGESAEISSLPLNSSLYQAFIAACCAPSFLNLQSYRFLLDRDTVIMVTLPDELTTADDARLNAGIAMLHFAGVLESHHSTEHGWVLGAPETSYKLPENAHIDGYYKIDIE